MRLTAHREAYCRDCGFCLFGLTDQCPECGQPFDPGDPFSYAPPDRQDDPWSWAMAGVVVLLVATVVVAILA